MQGGPCTVIVRKIVHQKTSMTDHQIILLGMSLLDVIFSFWCALTTLPVLTGSHYLRCCTSSHVCSLSSQIGSASSTHEGDESNELRCFLRHQRNELAQ
jgi:hypothetical protein